MKWSQLQMLMILLFKESLKEIAMSIHFIIFLQEFQHGACKPVIRQLLDGNPLNSKLEAELILELMWIEQAMLLCFLRTQIKMILEFADIMQLVKAGVQ